MSIHRLSVLLFTNKHGGNENISNNGRNQYLYTLVPQLLPVTTTSKNNNTNNDNNYILSRYINRQAKTQAANHET
jgi:hypothetical protein